MNERSILEAVALAIADAMDELRSELSRPPITVELKPAPERGQSGEKGEKGERGERGEKGDPGPAAEPVEICHEDIAAAIRGDTELMSQLRGDTGPAGPRGPQGLGIEVPAWAPGIYREGSYVMYAQGKIVRAMVDTAAPPSSREDWERIGTFGFEHRGIKQAGITYEVGDLFNDDGSSFLMTEAGSQMFVKAGQRGAKGEPGSRGLNAELSDASLTARIIEIIEGLQGGKS